MRKVFTFGIGQVFSGGYVTIISDEGSCREIMMKAYGKHWAFEYKNEEDAGVYRWNLRHVAHIHEDVDGHYTYTLPGDTNER